MLHGVQIVLTGLAEGENTLPMPAKIAASPQRADRLREQRVVLVQQPAETQVSDLAGEALAPILAALHQHVGCIRNVGG